MTRRYVHTRRVLLSVVLFAVITALASLGSDVEIVEAGLQRPAATLLSQTSFVSNVEGSSFQMSLLLSSPLANSIDDTTRLVVTSHRPVQSRSDVHNAIEGDLPQIIDAVSFPLTDFVDKPADRGSTRVDLVIPTEIGRRTDGALQMSATGVYPLTIDIEASGQRIVRLISFLERLGTNAFDPANTSPLDLALVGRLGPSVSLNERAAVEVSTASRRLMADWVELLERRPDFSATIAVQPEFLDSFSRSVSQDKELLIRMQRAAAFDVMSTTFVSVDPSDADRNGLTGVFTRQLRLGETALSSLFPARVAPRHSWLASSPLTPGGARVLADLGFRTVVLPPRAIEASNVDSTRLVELEFSDTDMIMGAVVDASLASSIEDGSTRPTGGEQLAAQHILAELKAIRSEMTQSGIEPGERALVLASESGDLLSPALADALWGLITNDPRFSFTPLDDAIGKMFRDGGLERVELTETFDGSIPFPASPNLGSVLQNLETTVDAFGSVLPSGDERVRSWSRVIDVLPDNRLSPSERQAYVDNVRLATQDISASIVPPASTTFTLGGRESPIRFSIRNDGSTDLEVRVRLTSSKLRLPEGDKIVLLPAQTSTAVEFAVSARSNGRFPVTLQLLTPSRDVPIGLPSTLTARVNALAGLGQLVTGIALLFLASWWANHFRRQYRQRQSEASLSSQRHPSGERPA